MNNVTSIIKNIYNYIGEKQGIIFDCDGTILDSMPMWNSLDIEYMQSLGIYVESDFHRAVSKLTLPEAAKYIKANYKTEYTSDEIKKQMLDIIEEHYKYIIPIKPRILEIIKHLKKSGKKIMVATANEYEVCRLALERVGVLPYIEGIISCTMVGAGKEKPDVYIESAKQMGLKANECVVFEDSLFAINTAKKAGFDVVAVYDDAEKDNWNKICEVTEEQVILR